MSINKIQILSTKIIGSTLADNAKRQNISIDEVAFIEIQDIISPALQKRIVELSGQNIAAIFTSANAVNAVKKILPGKPLWKIFCIGYKTKKTVADTFGNKNIIASADNGELLAEEIIKHPSIKEIFFFCGDQRREVLPEKLRSRGIELKELVVYSTIESPQSISKRYDGILFFSPSAVRSFFAVNAILNSPQLFAIGNTTAKEIKSFTPLPIIISPHPDKKELVDLVIRHFKTIKIS